MTDKHPITPPPELVEQWSAEVYEQTACEEITYSQHIATQAARWGADQELEACGEWFRSKNFYPEVYRDLRAARRPKPQSLKEQALGAVGRFTVNDHTSASEMMRDFDTIRRALEQLDD
jgi:hypothetical protein